MRHHKPAHRPAIHGVLEHPTPAEPAPPRTVVVAPDGTPLTPHPTPVVKVEAPHHEGEGESEHIAVRRHWSPPPGTPGGLDEGEAPSSQTLDRAGAVLVTVSAALMALSGVRGGNAVQATLSIGIALHGVAALTRRRWLLPPAVGLMLLGAALGLAGLLGLNLRPQWATRLLP